MGKAEEKVRKKIRRAKITKAIISTVAVAGVITVGAVAPKALELAGKTRFVRQWLYRARTRTEQLMREGYLIRDAKGRVRLTEKGERFAALMHEGTLAPKKPRRWDGKWRMLMFDIPEPRKGVRIKIRTTLHALGFLRLQDSVWVYPYDAEDFIAVLKTEYRIGKDVLYVIADHIEYDAPLRAHFGLPKEP